MTPKEHIGLPNNEDVRRGVVAFKIAAHAADIGLSKPGARDRDNAISDARAEFDCKYCTMCGPDFCSVRISARLKEAMKQE